MTIFTHPEGFTFRVFSAMYEDWGLEITDPDGNELYYSPSSLSNDSYGHKPNPKKYEDWEDAEEAAIDGDDDAFIPWDNSDWKECLADQADELLEAYTVSCKTCEKVVNPQTAKYLSEDFYCEGCSPV
jgi:hypothetical protein